MASTQSSVASAKRGAAERTGVHDWLSYYAGFSEAFVEGIIEHLSLQPGEIVLDPMNGSGTTSLVAQRNGLLAIGFDLNPAMIAIGRGKNAAFAGMKSEAVALAQEIVAAADNQTGGRSLQDDAAKWFHPQTFDELSRLWQGIDAARKHSLELAPDLRKLVGGIATSTETDLRDLLRAAVMLAVRKFSSATESKNPTWLKPGSAERADREAISSFFLKAVIGMAEDLERTFATSRARSSAVITLADARILPLPSNSVDAVITSPPYLTRIDYAVSTAPELGFLGFDSEKDLRQMRRSIMGSTCVSGGDYDVKPEWGGACRDLLDTIRGHTSKASATYYFKTHLQYFRDAYPIVAEALRVLKPGRSAVFVVQDSWYKDVHVPLGKIYTEMAKGLGAVSFILQSEHVRQHMGHVNTRARKYDKGEIFEHYVVMKKS